MFASLSDLVGVDSQAAKDKASVQAAASLIIVFMLLLQKEFN